MEKMPFETWDYTDQTKMKHQVFNDYIERWIKIVGKFHKLNYIDGFGDIGAYKDKDSKIYFGSPVLVAKAIEKITSRLQRKVQIVVTDEEKENLDNIRKIFEYEKIAIEPMLINQDFDKAINDILDKISNLAPTFVFVDPFGFKIRMETLERIMHIDRSEILLNFMFTRVNQFLSSPKIEKTCNELFGCDDWKKCTALNGSERDVCILEALRDRMKKFSKYVYYYKFEFASKKKSFYYLFHLSNYYLGCSIMKSSFAKFNFGRVEYRGGRAAQLGIFENEENVIKDIANHLRKKYSGQQKTYQNIVEEQIDSTPFLEKELKAAIKSMESESVSISRIPPKSKTGKNRTGIQEKNKIDRYDDKRMMVQLMGAMKSSMEINSFQCKKKFGIENSVRNGLMPHSLPYGCKIVYTTQGTGRPLKTREINEDEAVIVRRIYHEYVENGQGYCQIARILNDEKLKPRRGKSWTASTIRSVTSNPIYHGEIHFLRTRRRSFGNGTRIPVPQDEHIIANGVHKPIISKELFEKAQEIKKKKSKYGVRVEAFFVRTPQMQALREIDGRDENLGRQTSVLCLRDLASGR